MGIRDWFKSSSCENEEALGLQVELAPIGGSPELQALFIDIPAIDLFRAIDGWKWLPVTGLTAIAVSAFGEVFFRDSAGVVHQIDTIEGRLTKVANSLPELTTMLKDAEARDNLLLEGLVIGARKMGLILEPGECYDFKIAPVLGGKMGVEEMQKLSFVVKLHIAGQLHEQVKDLPPGTKINHVTISP